MTDRQTDLHVLVYVSDAHDDGRCMCGMFIGLFDGFSYVATDQEVSKIVTEYRKHARNGFSREELEFAEAVCCLKQICIVKVRHD